VLWALAAEGLDEARRDELERLMADRRSGGERLPRVRQLYREAGVFENAARLVDKYRQRAEAVADQTEPEELRRLLYYLIDTVLEDHSAATEPVALATLSTTLPT
jgi:hypothetical protein